MEKLHAQMVKMNQNNFVEYKNVHAIKENSDAKIIIAFMLLLNVILKMIVSMAVMNTAIVHMLNVNQIFGDVAMVNVFQKHGNVMVPEIARMDQMKKIVLLLDLLQVL
jgi:hypothetical protein